jgi:DNA-binding response OmpR family regulator
MSLAGVRCTVVEDDDDVARIIAVNLEAEGVIVTVARDGVDAEDLVATFMPDAVILDVMLPRRDGCELLAILKASPRTHHLPVALLTAKATHDDILRGWKSGADYYITKPFAPEQLLYWLQLLFSSGKASDT